MGPDQTPRSAASDLGLQCAYRPVCPNTLCFTVNIILHVVLSVHFLFYANICWFPIPCVGLIEANRYR